MDRRVQSERKMVGSGPQETSVRLGGLQKLLLLPERPWCGRTAWGHHAGLGTASLAVLGALVPGLSPWWFCACPKSSDASHGSQSEITALQAHALGAVCLVLIMHRNSMCDTLQQVLGVSPCTPGMH